jgi:hypothetical protein
MAHPPNIALTPQTDERNFPVWKKDAPPGMSGYPWPRMMIRPVTDQDIQEWRTKNIRRDPNSGREYFEDRPPKKDDPMPVLVNQDLVDAGLAPTIGEPVICSSPDHEEQVRRVLGIDERAAALSASAAEKPDTFMAPVDTSCTQAAEIERLEKENEDLRKKLSATPSVFPPLQAKSKSRSRSRSPAKTTLKEFAAS